MSQQKKVHKLRKNRWGLPIAFFLVAVAVLMVGASLAQASQPVQDVNILQPDAPFTILVPLISSDNGDQAGRRPTRTPTRLFTLTPSRTPRRTLTLSPSRTPTRTSTVLATSTSTSIPTSTPGSAPTSTPIPGTGSEYIVLGWNDLGMHCYNRSFENIAILPPYNNLYVQVIKRGNPPQIVSSGLNVEYSFPLNTYSVGKSDFWDNAQQLFGVALPPNIGLTGKGLAGPMDNKVDHFVAEGIPLTEFNDDDWNTPKPYQLADIVVKDNTGKILATNQVVAPVSTEMHCDNCHSDGAFGISTGNVETNILTLHDKEEGDDYPAGHSGPLMNRRPILCAECHASNALGAPGVAGIPNFSKAMHSKHAGKVPDTTDGCYNCHPGPTTKCMRDVMSADYNMGCTDCHGGMEKVKENPSPWLNEPRCDTCHTGTAYHQDQALYRQSKGHGGVYCAGCHDSTHAIAESSQPEDAIKFVNLQGYPGTLNKCTVCHLTQPTSGGPHQ